MLQCSKYKRKVSVLPGVYRGGFHKMKGSFDRALLTLTFGRFPLLALDSLSKRRHDEEIRDSQEGLGDTMEVVDVREYFIVLRFC